MIIETGMQKSNPSPFQIMSEQEFRDPVCGMTVTRSSAAGTVEHGGQPYYFCAPSCAAKFRANPEKYLNPRPEREPVAAGKYTCPMHPEIIREAPGSCPICGMALEPME